MKWVFQLDYHGDSARCLTHHPKGIQYRICDQRPAFIFILWKAHSRTTADRYCTLNLLGSTNSPTWIIKPFLGGRMRSATVEALKLEAVTTVVVT